jgi:Cys-rich repeat protein
VKTESVLGVLTIPIALLASCSSAQSPEAVECGTNGECPTRFVCDPGHNLCVLQGGVSVDAPLADAPLARPDAPLASPDAASVPDAKPSAPDAGVVNPFRNRIFEATSYSAATEPLFEITDGTPRLFAMLNAGGWVGPMVITPDGHFWIATTALGGSLWDVTAGGDFTGAAPFAQQIFGADVSYIEGMAVDVAGNFYLTNSETSPQALARIAPDGGITRTGTAFDDPTSVLVAGMKLYIGEGGAGRVVLHDLGSGEESMFAGGFVAGESHVSAQMCADEAGTLFILWSTAANGIGIYDITEGGDFTNAVPVVPVTFGIDVNQCAVSPAGDIYVAGASSGNCYVSRKTTNGYNAFVVFASGLDDTETLAIGH